MRQEIIETVKGLVNTDYLYFDTELVIRLTPHTWPLAIWGICVSRDDRIYLMDGGEEWNELCESDLNYDKVLPTLYQRVKQIEKRYLKQAI